MAITKYKSGAQIVKRFGDTSADMPAYGIPVGDTITVGIDNASGGAAQLAYSLDDPSAAHAFVTVDVGGNKDKFSASGLTLGTTYTATITIDGVVNNISITDAQTFGGVVNQIDQQLSYGICRLEGGDIVVKSQYDLDVSTVTVVDVDLFSSLADYASVSGESRGTITWIDQDSVANGNDLFKITEYGPTMIKVTVAGANCVTWVKT